MNHFSISQLSQFSGIKSHTLRIWEQRYNALKPNRTEGNTRYYDNSQLIRLLNIVSLLNLDYKVSEVCILSDAELFRLVDSQLNSTPIDESTEYYTSQLIAAGMSYDELYFDKIFTHCQLKFGLKATYQKFIIPMMVRIGLLWVTNKIRTAHEHFISNLLYKKINTAIASLPPANNDAEKWLLFLPENEFHELGLLFSNYLLRQSGKKTIYLGSNVPSESIYEAAEHTECTKALLFMVHQDTIDSSQKYLDNLKSKLNGSELYIAGNKSLLDQLETNNNFHYLTTVAAFEEMLLTN